MLMSRGNEGQKQRNAAQHLEAILGIVARDLGALAEGPVCNRVRIASGLRRMERTADPCNFPIRFGRGE
jgi:hypothetical protein